MILGSVSLQMFRNITEYLTLEDERNSIKFLMKGLLPFTIRHDRIISGISVTAQVIGH